jgi:hypothetical protein
VQQQRHQVVIIEAVLVLYLALESDHCHLLQQSKLFKYVVGKKNLAALKSSASGGHGLHDDQWLGATRGNHG